MNYYSFHVGDYAVHTIHLSDDEDLIYRRLIDLYYQTEKPITLDVERAARLIRKSGQIDLVGSVLVEFFLKTEDGYINKRCDAEITKYHAKAGRAKAANNKRWSEHVLKSDLKSDTLSSPNQEPRTKNQEPVNPKSRGATASRLPADWQPSDQEIAYCKTERPDLNPTKVAENFCDYWHAKAGAAARKVDWSATWRSWVRNEKPINGHASGFKSEKQRNHDAAIRAIYGTPTTTEKLITGEIV